MLFEIITNTEIKQVILINKSKYDSMISHQRALWINFCDHSRLFHQSLKNWPLLRGYFAS